MAGDWIKMRCELISHPKVVRILSATCTDKFRVIGGLHAVWSVFDQHSSDGVLHGYTPELMDHIIGWDGFSQAMIDVGWLIADGPQTLIAPEFTEHNGQSAKRRGEDQKRKRNVRRLSGNGADKGKTASGQNADKKRTREREERDIKESKPKKFIPPSVTEVRAYCQERDNGVDPQQLVDHYEANGWMRGKTSVKDWRACVRTWERTDKSGTHAEPWERP